MAGSRTKIGRKKEEAVVALLTQRNTEDAARVTGVGVRTLYRWLKEPEFRAAYVEARREAVSQTIARMQQATGAAGVTILKLMTDPNVPAAVRLRAAECVFSLAVKGIEIEDLEVRLSELERAVEVSRSAMR